MAAYISLEKLAEGKKASIRKISGKGPIKRRLLDMGLTKGAEIEMIKRSPLGDPIEYKVRGYYLSLRKEEAETIEVEV